MIEQWHVVTLEPGPRPALVLDLSESAAKIAPFLRSLASGVLEALPESSRPRIFFLGNPVPYDPADFEAKADEWFKANAGRGSVIGPVFETLEQEPDVMIAVAGAGRIFDLPDWHGHPMLQRTIWMRVGPVGVTEGVYPEEMYACEQLAELLNNPSLRVEVGGAGVMPFDWDDPSFRFENGKLVGERTVGQLRVGVLSPEPNCMRAAVVMSNQNRRELRLEPSEPLLPSEWLKLPHAEFMLLKQCLTKNHFHCPICKLEHPAGEFRCPTKKELSLFPTIEALPKGGFVLIDASSWETRIQPFPRPVMRLTPETAAVRHAVKGASIVRHDAASDSWVATGRFELFHPLGNKRHVMVV